MVSIHEIEQVEDIPAGDHQDVRIRQAKRRWFLADGDCEAASFGERRRQPLHDRRPVFLGLRERPHSDSLPRGEDSVPQL